MVNVGVFASGSGTNFEKLVTTSMKYAKIKLLIVDKEDAYAIKRAEKLNIPYVFVNPKAFATKAEYEMQILAYLQKYEIELIALAGYMRIIADTLLNAYPNKIVNIHPAYLPNFPGAHGILDAFNAKVNTTGVSIHYVDAGIDTGSIIYQEAIKIDPTWDLETLETHVHALEYKIYAKTIDGVCKEINDEKSVN